MPEPVRDQVLDKIVLKLQAMTGVRPWGGSYANAPTVVRTFRDLSAVNKFPHLIVLPGSGSLLVHEASGGGTTERFTDRFRVQVFGYVAGDMATPSSKWLERLQNDVIDTLLKAQKLDGVARAIEPNEDEVHVLDPFTDRPLAAFRQAFTVLFEEDKAVE